ncbi:hypothetical protein F1654_03875 [Alkalicaulis satelles]|uniref:DUF4136 domain-containing protein n=1 Tax=Alkalicaulis satelles TaxID=2609175 RepID=A0A5M6ZNH2_9PROT|nr:hypothetical protein [Alkalicaulis satelles]KAA5805134.1 hypothetical protein F1654_03875 [Alkalicaulis satelles]
MTKLIRLIAAAAIGGLLAACGATTQAPYYGPASSSRDGTGFSEMRIEDRRWRISYRGAQGVSPGDAERLAIRRAADVVLNNDLEWFTIADSRASQEGQARRSGSPVRVGGSVGRGWGSGGRRSSSVGLGVSMGVGGSQSRERAEAVIEIIAGSGEPRPEGAYDAAIIAAEPLR